MKINVLGTEYDVELLDKRDEYMKSNNLDGYCDFSTKTIFVCGKDSDFGNKESIEKKIVRHEIIHAFLNESGLFGENVFWHCEEMVDWLATQFPKIYEAFNKLDTM